MGSMSGKDVLPRGWLIQMVQGESIKARRMIKARSLHSLEGTDVQAPCRDPRQAILQEASPHGKEFEEVKSVIEVCLP